MSSQDQSNKNQELLNSLVKDAYAALSDGHVSFGEVVSLGGSLAGKVNQFPQLSGSEKRDLVLDAVDRALKQILDEMGSELQDLSRIQKVKEAADFAKQTLPSVLNLAVDAARGKIDLKKPECQRRHASLMSVLTQCFSRQSVQEPKKVEQIQEVPKEELKEPAPEIILEKTPEVAAVDKVETISPPESTSA